MEYQIEIYGEEKVHPEMRKPYKYGWFTAVVDRTGLSLVSVESQIDGYIWEEEAHHIVILQQ